MVDQDKVQEFLRLHSKYQNRIYGFVMSHVADWNVADDVYQDTLGVLWKKYAEYTPETNFLAWALKIAHFQVLSYQKRQQIRKRAFSQEAIDNLVEVAISSADESDQTLAALRKCVKKLSVQARQLLTLRYDNGLTVRKISEQIQRNIHTLYKDYQKIHRMLFQCVRKQSGWE